MDHANPYEAPEADVSLVGVDQSSPSDTGQPRKSTLSRRLALANRLVMGIGVASLLVAALYTVVTDAPDWFDEAILSGCLVAGVPLVVAWGVLELLVLLPHSVAWKFFQLIVSTSFVIVPCLKILPAALFGQSHADFQTWHLLPLFAALHTVVNVVFFTGCGALCVPIGAFLVRRRRRSSRG